MLLVRCWERSRAVSRKAPQLTMIRKRGCRRRYDLHSTGSNRLYRSIDTAVLARYRQRTSDETACSGHGQQGRRRLCLRLDIATIESKSDAVGADWSCFIASHFSSSTSQATRLPFRTYNAKSCWISKCIVLRSCASTCCGRTSWSARAILTLQFAYPTDLFLSNVWARSIFAC